MYNGMSLNLEVNVKRLVAALWVVLGTKILSEIRHTDKETYPKKSLIRGFLKSLHMNWITKQNRFTHLYTTLMAAEGEKWGGVMQKTRVWNYHLTFPLQQP